MKELPDYYTTLFNTITDALEALERLDIGTAKEILRKGQQAAEEAYIAEER